MWKNVTIFVLRFEKSIMKNLWWEQKKKSTLSVCVGLLHFISFHFEALIASFRKYNVFPYNSSANKNQIYFLFNFKIKSFWIELFQFYIKLNWIAAISSTSLSVIYSLDITFFFAPCVHWKHFQILSTYNRMEKVALW